MDHDPDVTPALPAHERVRAVPGDDAVIRQALEAIVASHAFSTSARLRRFVRFIVEETLAGRGGGLKEYVIGTDVCDRPPDFDPRVDPVVRVEARRLRRRLADYYAGEGREAMVVVSVPTGAYVPAFVRREPGGSPPGNRAGPVRRLAGRPARALAALLLAGMAAWLWEGVAGEPEVPANAIAVLPFQNLSADPGHDTFASGLAAALTEVRELRVVMRTPAGREAGTADVRDLGQRLRVRYVVEGSVRCEGQRLRVTARLVETRDGAPVWTHTYDRPRQDVATLQRELARAIAGALVLRLRRLAEVPGGCPARRAGIPPPGLPAPADPAANPVLL